MKDTLNKIEDVTEKESLSKSVSFSCMSESTGDEHCLQIHIEYSHSNGMQRQTAFFLFIVEVGKQFQNVPSSMDTSFLVYNILNRKWRDPVPHPATLITFCDEEDVGNISGFAMYGMFLTMLINGS